MNEWILGFKIDLPLAHANVQSVYEDFQSFLSNASIPNLFCCIQAKLFQLDQKILSGHNLPQLILNWLSVQYFYREIVKYGWFFIKYIFYYFKVYTKISWRVHVMLWKPCMFSKKCLIKFFKNLKINWSKKLKYMHKYLHNIS